MEKEPKIEDELPEENQEDQRSVERVQLVSGAQTFEDLYSVIEKFVIIPGSKDFSATEIVELIDEARKGTVSINYITRTYGIRQKVQELINAEK